MADASFVQTSFLGGEWSPTSQGRMDDPRYRTGLNQCLNAHPTETGAWVRRSGTRLLTVTRCGAPARVVAFDFTQTEPYLMEFTDGHLRFLNKDAIVPAEDARNVTGISTDNPAEVTTSGGSGTWVTGDQVFFFINGPSSNSYLPLILGRTLMITVVDSTHFTISDPSTGAPVDGTALGYTAGDALQVIRVLDLATPYIGGAWKQVRAVQDETTVLLLHGSYAPEAVTAAADGGATFAIAPAVFQDGPYLDSPTDGTTLTPGGTSGSISITLSATTSVAFASTDVGRMVRIFAGPVPSDPTQDTRMWTWGLITAVSSSSVATLSVQGANLVSTDATELFMLGVYSDTTGWPTCGTYHEGRLWLAGAVPNRVDSSMANQHFVFSPTGPDGTVADDNGMSLIFDSPDQNEIYWLIPDAQGVLCGTIAGEWLVRASTLGDPLTPTSIQVARVSRYGCANVEPRRAGLSIAFVQRFGRKVMEYVCDLFSSKFSALNLTVDAKHLTVGNVEELGYQQELLPVVWARTGDGQLIGTTYKRESLMVSQPPTFNGWHHHLLGTGRLVESITIGPSPNGLIDSLSMVTNDPNTNVRWIEQLTEMFDEDGTVLSAWFADAALTPGHSQIVGSDLVMSGLWPLNGLTVSPFVAGVDAGDQTVVNGQVSVPLTGSFTQAFLKSVSDAGGNFGDASMTIRVPQSGASGQTIQWFPFASDLGGSGIGYGSVFAEPDYENNTIYFVNPGHGAAAGGSCYSTKTCTEIFETTATAMFGADALDLETGEEQAALSPTYGYFSRQPIGSNSGWLQRNRLSNLLPSGASDQSVTGSEGVNQVSSACLMTFGNPQDQADLIVVGPDTHSTVQFVDASSMRLVETVAISEGRAAVCQGPVGNAYGIGYATTSSTAPLGLYKFGNVATLGSLVQKIGTVAPSAIDTAWVHITAAGPIVYDQTDGNILLAVSNSGSGDVGVTNENYIIKLNTATVAVMWAVPVAALPGASMNRSRIKNGIYTMAVSAAGFHIYQINTLSGAVTTPTVTGVTQIGDQVWDDVTGMLTIVAEWSSLGPAPLGSTPATQGGTPRWVQLYIPPPTPPGAYFDTYTVPGLVGITYISQGQILRPEAPQDTGARNGPGFGKTRRLHRYAMRMVNTTGMSVGTDFSHLYPVVPKSPGRQTTYSTGTLFSGEVTDILSDDYSLNGMICWQVTRPWPANIVAVGGFIQAQDR